MPDADTFKYVDWALYFVILALALTVLVRIAEAHAVYKQSLTAIEPNPEAPDLLQQAIINVAMSDMQKKLRELLVYTEPNELNAVLREYIRLKEAQKAKEKNDLSKKKPTRTRRRSVQVP